MYILVTTLGEEVLEDFSFSSIESHNVVYTKAVHMFVCVWPGRIYANIELILTHFSYYIQMV